MIKKLSLFAFMALAISTPVQAAEIDETDIQICEMLGAAATAVMTARQNSTSPIYIRDRLKAILVKHEMLYVMPMIDIYITEAYEQTAYSTEKMKDWAIASFQSDKEAECLRHFFKKDDA
jgi:hypothetical protein